jgi:metal-responsive CopG/Arc/MetJ family transcriptional regulator
MFDEKLLAELDADEEVQKRGRSAVLRAATAAYLHRRRAAQIARAYRRGYRGSADATEDLEGWSEQAVWPDE